MTILQCLHIVARPPGLSIVYCLAPAKKSHIGPRCAGHFPAVVK